MLASNLLQGRFGAPFQLGARAMILRLLSLLALFAVLPSQACTFDQVAFDNHFSGARLDGCEQLGENRFLLSSQPENRPINNSPWYAFKVTAKPSRELEIVLEFDGNVPRYLPKVSHDGKTWQVIPFDIEGKQLSVRLQAGPKPIWLAGQEVIDNQAYEDWYAENSFTGVKKQLLGLSTEKRPIHVLRSERPDSKEWVVMVGRQHPPEITGALAMFPFMETMLGDQGLAVDFRSRFNLLIIPNLNPDGVHHGNWRHNKMGVDLNRDWKSFEQVETRLVHDAIQAIIKQGGKLVFAMDFHSTQQDIFYTMPSDLPLAPAKLVEQWLESLGWATRSTFVVRPRPGHNPDMGVFKQYIADTYQVHAVTYEMGDNTERHLIQHVARHAANTLMQILLATAPEEFYYQPSEAVQ